MDEQHSADISARFIRFADEEAHGRSPLYEELARGVASDRKALDFLLTLPKEKRQPNLLLAAMRHLYGTPIDWSQFRRTLSKHGKAVRTLMLERSTQTNEPGRCATLLPLLARLPQPLALIEVGASAGLCLIPDHYGYDYGSAVIHADKTAPIFRCTANEITPLPAAVPQVVWRAGLDLNPLDVADPGQSAWLETLVWPEQTGRLANLRAAMKIAAKVKPRVVKGDLLGDELSRVCREAPKDVTLVVFHTAVLGYVSGATARQAFAERVRGLCRYWISNESPRVFPDIASRAGGGGRPHRFLLSMNGSPVAWTDPHGASLEWIAAGA